MNIMQDAVICWVSTCGWGLLWAPLHPGRTATFQAAQLGLRDKSRERKLQGQFRANPGKRKQKEPAETASSQNGNIKVFGLWDVRRKSCLNVAPIPSLRGRCCAGADCITTATAIATKVSTARPWRPSRRVVTACLRDTAGLSPSSSTLHTF